MVMEESTKGGNFPILHLDGALTNLCNKSIYFVKKVQWEAPSTLFNQLISSRTFRFFDNTI